VCVCVCSMRLCPLYVSVCVLQTFAKSDTRCKTAQWSSTVLLIASQGSTSCRVAPPCSLTKSINTMQAQHDEGHVSEPRTWVWDRSQARVRARAKTGAGATAIAFAGRVMYRHCRT